MKKAKKVLMALGLGIALSVSSVGVSASATTVKNMHVWAPRSLTANFDSQNYIELVWKASHGAIGYNIYVNSKKIGYVTSNSYVVGPVTAVGKYVISVKSVNSKGIESKASSSTIVKITSLNSAPATFVQPVSSVGTYNDFGQSVRMDINPKNTNAASFKVEWEEGYKPSSYSHSFTVSSAPNVQNGRYQWVVRTGFQATQMGWVTFKVTSIGSDGSQSKSDRSHVVL